jgi:hypothetical protein
MKLNETIDDLAKIRWHQALVINPRTPLDVQSERDGGLWA